MRGTSAILCFTAATAIVALALGSSFSGLNIGLALLALVAGLAVGVIAWRQTPSWEKPRLHFWDWVVLGVFTLVSLRAFLWLVFANGNDLQVLSPNNLGDLGMHVNFIRYFASGIPFWPDSPILTGVPLSYPFGIDLFNTVLELLGADTFRGLIWTGLIGAGLTGWVLWRWGGAFGVAALLFNGGLTGFVFFQTLQVDDFQRDLVWKNLFLSMVITQRGLLFALPAGLLLLTTWRDRYFREEKKTLPFWVQLLLYAAMPFFSIHTFLFLSFVLLAIFCFCSHARVPLMVLVGSALVPATLLVWLVTANFSVASGFRWLPAWIMEDKGWTTWFWDFGVTLPLMAVLVVLLVRIRDREARCLVWTAALIFLVCCLCAIAPWPWDNMKLMMWSWLVIAPYLWSKIILRLDVASRAAVCFLLFFSGAISLIGGLDGRHGYTIARLTELDGWRHLVRNIPAEARFAFVPEVNHPLLLLGRKGVCGYEGHLWSHGLDYRKKYAMLNDALHGRVSWEEAAPALGADWLALKLSEIATTSSPDLIPPVPPRNCLYDLSPFIQEGQSTQSHQPFPPRSED